MLLRERMQNDTGNVVIELVLAVTLFGSVLLPSVQAISAVASAYRLAEDTSVTVARAWTVTDAAMRASVISTLRAKLVARAGMSLTIHVTCTPSCESYPAEVRVSSFVATRVPGFSKVESTYVLDRDSYGL
jgi:hypothetical protein